MARPKRKNVEYFPFYCKEGKTVYYLDSKYGNDGYATHIKILARLAVSENHFIDLSNNAEFMYLSAKCKVSVEKLGEIINDLVLLGDLDAELWNNYKVLFSQKLVDSLIPVYDKRANGIIKRETILNDFRSRNIGFRTENTDSRSNNPQSKVKESKVEESKEKNYKKILLSEVKPSDFPNLKPDHIEMAKAFQNLFRNNLKEAGAATVNVDKAKGTWVDDIRLILGDGYTNDDLRAVYGFLQSNSFWKKNILSTSKLREKFDKLKLEIKHGTGRRNDNKNAGRDLGELAEILHKHTTAFS